MPVTLRGTPALSFSGTPGNFAVTNGADTGFTIGGISANILGVNLIRVSVSSVTGSPLTTGQGSTLLRNASLSAFIDVSSEL